LEILGHRGARHEAPENTLSGFRYLRDLGIRAVEFDIQVAGDGELVVIHDDRVDRTTSGQGPLREFSTAELAQLDACHHRRYPITDVAESDWPVQEGVPTLAAVLEVLRDFHHLQLEVKARREEDVAVVVRRLPELWRPFGQRAITTSFDAEYLRRIRLAAPEIPRGLLIETDHGGDPVREAVELGCVSLGPHYSLCTPELVQQAHAAGLKVSPWTVNSDTDLLAMRDLGVDSAITDVPRRALALLGG
jgi:glycerophosphoryl diester phosphodiesterase